MRDFDLEKSKDAFLNYIKWRVDSKVDFISHVRKNARPFGLFFV